MDFCLTSVSKGSANHSQRLPLDRDANRALTDPVPPSLRLGLIHHPPNKTSGCSDQTRHSEAAALVNVSLSTYAHKYIHMHVVSQGHIYTNPCTMVIHHSLTKQTMHHIHTCIHVISIIIACDKT